MVARPEQPAPALPEPGTVADKSAADADAAALPELELPAPGVSDGDLPPPINADAVTEATLGALRLDGGWRQRIALPLAEQTRLPIALTAAIALHAGIMIWAGGSKATAQLGAGGDDFRSLEVGLIAASELSRARQGRARSPAQSASPGPAAKTPGSDKTRAASSAQADAQASRGAQAASRQAAQPPRTSQQQANKAQSDPVKQSAPSQAAPQLRPLALLTPTPAPSQPATPEKPRPQAPQKQPPEPADETPALRPAMPPPDTAKAPTDPSQQPAQPPPQTDKTPPPANPTQTAKTAEPIAQNSPPRPNPPKPEPPAQLKTPDNDAAASPSSAPRAQSAATQAGGGQNAQTADEPAARASARLAAGKVAQAYNAELVKSLAGLEGFLNATSRTRDSRLRGQVIVLLTIGNDGRAEDVSISKSSGLARLDKLAVEDLSRFQFPRAPAALSRAQRTYTLPITYR